MSKPINVGTLEAIDKKIIELNLLKNRINYFLQQENISLHEEILRKYIELQNVVNVANYLNGKGYRLAGKQKENIKYSHNDVGELIKMPKEKIEADINLIIFVKNLFDFNKGKTSWNMLLKHCKL